MKFDIKLPADLTIVKQNVNLLWTGDGGLIEVVGFRAKVDGEMAEKFWPVGGGKEKAIAVLEEQIFPHLRNVFAEEMAEVEEAEKQAEAARTKVANRAARLQEKAVEQPGRKNKGRTEEGG